MDAVTVGLLVGDACVVLYCAGSLVHRGHQMLTRPASARTRLPAVLRRHDDDCARLHADPTGPDYWTGTGFPEVVLWRLAERSWGQGVYSCGCVSDPYGTAWRALEIDKDILRARWEAAGFTPVTAARWLIDTSGDTPVTLRFLRDHPEHLTVWRNTGLTWDALDDYAKTALKQEPADATPDAVNAYRTRATSEGWATAWRDLTVDTRYRALRRQELVRDGDTTTEEVAA